MAAFSFTFFCCSLLALARAFVSCVFLFFPLWVQPPFLEALGVGYFFKLTD
jgi:hypothetical protein